MRSWGNCDNTLEYYGAFTDYVWRINKGMYNVYNIQLTKGRWKPCMTHTVFKSCDVSKSTIDFPAVRSKYAPRRGTETNTGRTVHF